MSFLSTGMFSARNIHTRMEFIEGEETSGEKVQEK